MTTLGRLTEIRPNRTLDGRDWVEVGALAVLGALCAYGVHRVFGAPIDTVPILGAAGVSVALIALLELRRPPVWVSAVVSLVAMVIYTAYAQLSSTMPVGIPGFDTFRALWDGLYTGWAEGLDGLFPLAANGPTSLLMTYLTWIAAAVAAMAMLRARHVVWPIVPLLGLYAVTLPLAAPAPDSGIWLPLAIAVASLFVVALRSNQRRPVEERAAATRLQDASDDPQDRVAAQVLDRDFQSRSTALSLARSAIPLALVCALVGGVVGPYLGFGADDPVDPRSFRPENITPEAIINPLTEFKAVRAQAPPVPALALELLGEGDADILRRLPMALLDSYDGAQWRSSARYGLRDPELGDRSANEADSTLITQVIALETLRGPWLPAAQRPVWISLPEVMFHKESGSMLAPTGTVVDNYTVTSRVPTPSLEALQAASVGSVDDRYVELPKQVSADIIDLATNVAAPFESPYDISMALMEYLQDEIALDVAASPGHSLGRLREFLLEDERGGQEQFATALAVMLRTQQVPARVVLGFDLGAAEDIDGDGSLDITSAQYDVWVEVAFDDLGWQAFDPVPVNIAVDEAPEETPGTTIPAAPTAVATPQAQPTEGSPSEAIDQGDEPTTTTIGAWVFPSLLAVLLLGVVLAMVVYVLASKRRRRKRRRRAPTPVGRIEGAWADATDRLLEAGVEVAPDFTFSEVAAASDEAFGPDASQALRALVPDVAANAFAPTEPGSDVAERAWRHADAYRADTAKARPVVKRVGERLNPRPLVKNR